MHKPDSPNPPADLLTTEQVMDILMADANLRRRAATCVLPAVSVGGRTSFPAQRPRRVAGRLVASRAWTRDVNADEVRARD